jgi:hypothetical protein
MWEKYVPRTTIHRVLHKQLHLSAYKVQITEELKPEEKPKLLDFATDELHRIDMDPNFLPNIWFSEQATFRQPEKVGRHNTRTWSSENPLIHRQAVRDSPKQQV